MLAASVELGA